MKEQLYTILEKLIIKNNIQVNKEELKLQLSSHPSYPSLHALTGVLDHFNISNLALRLSVNKEILKQLPEVFIANITTDKGEDLVLVEKKKRKIKITVDTNKTEFIEEETFLSQWNGVIVAIEKDEERKETQTNRYTSIAKWALVFCGLLCIGYLLITQTNFLEQSHFVLSIIGLVLSVFIIKQDLGIQSSVTNQFCNLSEKTSCDAVLNSKGATVFGLFKLSDSSIVAFSCFCLSWMLFFINGAVGIGIMSIVTLLAFPFVVYSLYYQYKVVKKWCPLCLGIASILLSQCAVVLFDGFYSVSFVFNESIVLFLMSIVTVTGIWSFLKPLVKKKESLQKTAIAYYKFKRKSSLFRSLYNESEVLSVVNYFDKELVFGNKNATVELVLVTSPLCFFCKKAHRDIEYLLDKLQGSIKVIVRFNVTTSDKDNLLYKIVSRVLDIYTTNGENEALKALQEVYHEDVNLQKWLDSQTYKVTTSFDDMLDKQSKWCQANTINFTPALYLNNKLFPQEYDRTDLIYFIDDLMELQSIPKNAIAS